MVERNLLKNSTFNKYFYLSLGFATLFLIYFSISFVNKDGASSFIFPSIGEIFQSMGDILSNNNSLVSIGWSFLRIIITLVISYAISEIISLLYILFKPSIYFFKPFIYFIKTAPIAAISIFLWLALGGNTSPYFVSAMVMIPLMIEANLTSLNNINKDIMEETTISGANRFQSYWKIYYPITMPFQLMVVLQCFGLGFKVEVMAEYLCYTNNSIGMLLHNYVDALEIGHLLAIVVIIVIIVFIIDIFLNIYKKYVESNL